MLSDKLLVQAVSRIIKRSERQTDDNKLISSFVDVGVIPELDNFNNQIFYGRRGTGKTHVLKFLSQSMGSENLIPVYIDTRVLGSSSQIFDTDERIGQRCLALFRDILNPVTNVLLEAIFEKDNCESEKAFESLENLQTAINKSVETYVATTKKKSTVSAALSKDELSAEFSLKNISVRAGNAKESNSLEKVEEIIDIETEDKVVFPQIHCFLSEILHCLGVRLLILIDEWSSLPNDIQPFLAEFLKKGLFTVPSVTIKIAAIEYRSYFFDKNTRKGFELSSDISVMCDLDDYFVYDRNPDELMSLYGDIIYKHICLEIGVDKMRESFGVASGKDLQSKLFTSDKAFKELARASEGVVRDLISIFALACVYARKESKDKISKKIVIESSRQWFEKDKYNIVDSSMETVLKKIIDDVIGAKKARSFLLPIALERHFMIQKLFDARVIHRIKRGYADKDNPGVRYNVYSLDYGTYVDLIGTNSEPQIDFLFPELEKEDEIVVPFDDNRSIRRIILHEDVLAV